MRVCVLSGVKIKQREFNYLMEISKYIFRFTLIFVVLVFLFLLFSFSLYLFRVFDERLCRKYSYLWVESMGCVCIVFVLPRIKKCLKLLQFSLVLDFSLFHIFLIGTSPGFFPTTSNDLQSFVPNSHFKISFARNTKTINSFTYARPECCVQCF